MGDVMRLSEARSSHADMPAGHIDETDTLATILSVTKYWESAITQIGTCQIGLPDSSKERLSIELASLAKKLRVLKLILDEHKTKRASPDQTGR